MLKIPATSSHKLNFRALYEPDKANYTKEQEKTAGKVKELLHQRSSNIEKGLSYLDYYEKDFKLDLCIQQLKKDKGIELYSINKMTGEKEFIRTYHGGDEPNGIDLLDFLGEIEEDAKTTLESIGAFVCVGLLFLATMFISPQKITTKQAVDKAIKRVECLQNVSSKVNADTIPLFNKLVK